MKRQVYRMTPRAGSMDRLIRIEEDLPAPAAEEVSVRVQAIGLNFADIFAIFGLYGATPKGSFIPGLEFAGEVIATGDEVKGYKTGDRVMGVTRFGGYADHLNIEHHYVEKLPADWAFEDGAAFPVQALTAYYALVELGNIQQGQTVLIHSAAGGVGIMANRIAKKFDAYTIGTIGSESKIDLLKEEGYDAWIVRSDHFKEDLQKTLDGQELNIVMECIGGKILKDGFRILAPEGRMIVYGSARYATPGKRPNYLKLLYQYWKRPKIDPQGMIEWNKSIMGFNLIHLYHGKEKFAGYMQNLKKLNPGKPYIGHVFEFEQLKEALRLFQTGKTRGKVVVGA